METDIKRLAVQAMQDYIDSHVFDSITPNTFARITGYSPWYASRLFFQLLGLTPADYIRRLKLSKCALRLRDENVLITDVALSSGFNSVDGFQRAFFKEFGCNPKAYANNPIPIYLFQPYRVTVNVPEKESNMDNLQTIFVQCVEKPARKVIIKRGKKASDYWEYCQEVGCDVWGLLLSIKSISEEPVCLWLPEQYRTPGTSEYVQGAEVSLDFSGVVPEGFDVITLPSSTYLLFCSEPFDEEYYEEAIKRVWEAVKKYNPKLFGFEWNKDNPRIQLEPRGERGYRELLPVKKA